MLLSTRLPDVCNELQPNSRYTVNCQVYRRQSYSQSLTERLIFENWPKNRINARMNKWKDGGRNVGTTFLLPTFTDPNDYQELLDGKSFDFENTNTFQFYNHKVVIVENKELIGFPKQNSWIHSRTLHRNIYKILFNRPLLSLEKQQKRLVTLIYTHGLFNKNICISLPVEYLANYESWIYFFNVIKFLVFHIVKRNYTSAQSMNLLPCTKQN